MTPEQLKRLANQIAQQTYDYIISCSRIDRVCTKPPAVPNAPAVSTYGVSVKLTRA